VCVLLKAVFPESEPHPDEQQVTGPAGSVFIMDSRLWHAVPARAANNSSGSSISGSGSGSSGGGGGGHGQSGGELDDSDARVAVAVR
jgi:hypothetical protein